MGGDDLIVIFIGTLSEEESQLLNDLFEKHHVMFYNISLGILRSHSDAEDAVSQSFLKVIDYIDRISRLPKSKILPYCIIIVKNESFNILNKQKKDAELEDTLIQEFDEFLADPIDELFSSEDDIKAALQEAIDALPDPDRYFIHLRFANQMSLKEIAKILDISDVAARKRSERVIKKLNQLCQERVIP